jgi:hypothetical protein
MNAKERDTALRQWQALISRETRDLASLEQVGARALQDRDVCGDVALERLVRERLAQRRAEIEREQQATEIADRASLPAARRSEDVGRRTFPSDVPELLPRVQPQMPPSLAPSPVSAQITFDDLAQTLGGWLGRGDEDEARAVYEQMRVLQEESPGVISVSALQPYEEKIAKLTTRLGEFRVQIAALAQQAVTASRSGDEPAAATLLRRLSAIHVTYPRLLDEARLDEIRADMVHASEEHEDGVTAHQLVERERAVAAEIRKIAAAVREFHRVVCEVPESSAEFRSAEAAYLQILREVRAHDPEWLAGFVLELADLLAEWRTPPQAARTQVDRFLENVRLSLENIRAEIGRIETKRDEAG